MDFDLTEEQEALKKTVRRFMDTEIIPSVDGHEERQEFPSREIIKKLIPFGYIGGLLPEEAGGMGLDYISYFILIEELGRAWSSIRTVITTNNMILTNIYKHGTEEQKGRFLRPMLNGDKLAFFGLTEPNVGSDAASLESRATLDGDDYILNGTKTLITHGSKAEMGLVFATIDRSKGAKGICAFLVERDTCHYTARDIEKMGMRASVISELHFEDCRVPRKNLLGQPGEGLKIALAGLNIGRCTVAFAVIGVAQACIDASVKYAQERKQFGKVIGGFQLVQEMIAEMVMENEAARLLGLRAAHLLQKGLPCAKEAAMAKLFATEAALKIASNAIQIHGGYGYTREFPVERYYRDIRHLTMAEGTSQIQKLIIGREVLGISAFN